MAQFQPDQATFNDAVGYGQWDIGHAREHIQFVQVLAAKTPAVLLPDWNLLSMLSAGNLRGQIMEAHQSVHELLRDLTGVAGFDYTAYKMDDESDFYTFLGHHSTEHQALRQALGMT